MKNTDTGILSSEADECSNFPGTKPELNRGLPRRSPCLVLHLFRLLSCCGLPPSGSGWRLAGNNLGCYHHGPRSDLHPSAAPQGGASPAAGAAEAWAETSFHLCWLCLLPLQTCLLVLCLRQGESMLSRGSGWRRSLPTADANQKHGADPTIILQCRKSGLFFREHDKNWLLSHLQTTWGWLSDLSKQSHCPVTQMMSEMKLSGDGCTALPSWGRRDRQGLLLPAVLSKLLQVAGCMGNLNMGGRKKGRTFQSLCRSFVDL